MEQETQDYYNKKHFAELITITKTGIVNTEQILVDPRHEQIIHGDKLIYRYHTALRFSEYEDHIKAYQETPLSWFNAVYYNGVQIVRKGKVCY